MPLALLAIENAQGLVATYNMSNLLLAHLNRVGAICGRPVGYLVTQSTKIRICDLFDLFVDLLVHTDLLVGHSLSSYYQTGMYVFCYIQKDYSFYRKHYIHLSTFVNRENNVFPKKKVTVT
jgi:hypothetical protein